MSKWAWDRYERTHWINPLGRKLYFGHFSRSVDGGGHEICVVRFWANRPVIALRQIVASDKNPEDYADSEVN